MTSKPGPMFADEQGTPVARGQFGCSWAGRKRRWWDELMVIISAGRVGRAEPPLSRGGLRFLVLRLGIESQRSISKDNRISGPIFSSASWGQLGCTSGRFR